MMKKRLVPFLILMILLAASVSALAAEPEVLRLDAEDISLHTEGTEAVFKMMDKESGTKKIEIEEQAVNYLLEHGLTLVVNTPKAVLEFPGDAFFTAEWDQAVKTGEPVKVRIIWEKGNLSKVAENFDSWYYGQLGLYRFGEVAYQLSGETLVCDQKNAEIGEFAAPVALTVAYPFEEALNVRQEESLSFYVFNEETGKWEVLEGNVDTVEKTISYQTGKTGLMTILYGNKKPQEFSDIEGHWAENDILFMLSKNVVKVEADGKFYPNQAITRAKFCGFLVRTLHINESAGGEQPFTDVAADNPYHTEIIAAAKAGIVNGVAPGRFDPAREITREEMAVMMDRALQYARVSRQPAEGLLARFGDQDQISSWAREGAAASVDAGLIGGRDGGRFAPKADTSRAEALVMLHRLYGIIN